MGALGGNDSIQSDQEAARQAKEYLTQQDLGKKLPRKPSTLGPIQKMSDRKESHRGKIPTEIAKGPGRRAIGIKGAD